MGVIQLKTADEIRDDIFASIAADTDVSDANLGSVTRTKAYAFGVEQDELYFALWRALQGSYIKKATGANLDYRANDWGLARLDAVEALGWVTFTGTPATVVPFGTQVSVPATPSSEEIVFQTIQALPVGGGGTVEVPIMALVSGEKGNVAAGQITHIKTAVSGVSAVVNAGKMHLGADEEDDDTLRDRILDTLANLTRGTIPAILHGAIDFELQEVTLWGNHTAVAAILYVYEDLEDFPFSGQTPHYLSLNNGTEIVTYAGVDTSSFPHSFTGVVRGVIGVAVAHNDGVSVKEYIPTGQGESVTSAGLVETLAQVDVYLDDGTLAGPCTELVDLVEKRLQGDGTDRDPGYRGAGIVLYAHARTVIPVNVTANITIDGLYDYTAVCADVTTAIEDYINGCKVGETVRAYEVVNRIMDVGGVQDINSLQINTFTFDGTQSANVLASSTQVARAGITTVT